MPKTGRTVGSKNRSGHKAGGARAGSGRPSKEVAAQRAEEKRQKAAQEAARKDAEREKRQKQQERERKQRQVRRERIEKQTMLKLRRSATSCVGILPTFDIAGPPLSSGSKKLFREVVNPLYSGGTKTQTRFSFRWPQGTA